MKISTNYESHVKHSIIALPAGCHPSLDVLFGQFLYVICLINNKNRISTSFDSIERMAFQTRNKKSNYQKKKCVNESNIHLSYDLF